MSDEEKKTNPPVLDVLKSVWQEYCSEDATTSSTDITDDGMMCQMLRDLNDGWSIFDAINTIESQQAKIKELKGNVNHLQMQGIKPGITLTREDAKQIEAFMRWHDAEREEHAEEKDYKAYQALRSELVKTA